MIYSKVRHIHCTANKIIMLSPSHKQMIASNPYAASPKLAAQQLGASIKMSSLVALKIKPIS